MSSTETQPVADDQPRGIHAVRPGASVLLIEDSDTLRRSLALMVERMGLFDHIHTAGDGFEGFRILRQEQIDLVLCDLRMPRCDGHGFLKLKQHDPRTAEIPVVMLTAADDVATRVALLGGGACDYLSKPAHADEMRARVSIHLRLKQLHDELRHKSEALEELSRTDNLTGVPNRRHLDEVLKREFDRAHRYRRPVSALMIDLDRFKKLNDTHGHLAGDQALRAVARILQEQVRKPDVVARYGGEEFCVVMPETAPKHALIAAERIRREIEVALISWEGQRLEVTASIGVAGFPSRKVACPEDLLEQADEGLYSAKSRGRNRVVHVCGDTVARATRAALHDGFRN